jgi:TRAP-type uncharacterized transport system fused permease subunit
VDTTRLSQGDMIAGAGGVGLFIFLFLGWFDEFSAWELFDLTDILLALMAVVVIALVASRATGNDINVPGGRETMIALLGFGATMIVLTWVFEGEERGIGLWLSLVAALAILYGGWQTLRGGPAAHRTTTTPAQTTTTPGAPPPPPAA